MNISFKEILDYPELEQIVIKDPDLFLAFSEFQKFIHHRINVLRDEIDAEENAANNLEIGILIHMREGRIQFLGYSSDLKRRIIGCLNDGSLQFFTEKINKILESRYN